MPGSLYIGACWPVLLPTQLLAPLPSLAFLVYLAPLVLACPCCPCSVCPVRWVWEVRA